MRGRAGERPVPQVRDQRGGGGGGRQRALGGYASRVALSAPPPISFNPLRRLTSDLVAEGRTEVPFPSGETSFSLRRTRQFAANPLRLLLDAYERFGPVFTL